MTARKTTNLTALTTPTGATLVAAVDLTEGAAANQNKKLALSDLTKGLSAATTGAAGVVQLSTSTSSTSTTLASTPSAVKSAYDLANAALPLTGGTISGNLALGGGTLSSSANTGGIAIYGGSVGNGANIELYGGSHASYPDLITFDAGEHRFRSADASSQRMCITSTGNVGIGTSNPSQLLQVNGSALIGATPAAQYSNFTVVGDSAIQAASPLFNFVNAAGSTRFGYINHTGTAGDIYILNQEAGALRLGSNNQERLRVDSSGRLLVGTSSARNTYLGAGVSAGINVEAAGNLGASNRSVSVVNGYSAAADGDAILYLGRTRSDAIGGTTIVQNNDNIGRIAYVASDGANMLAAAQIQAIVDGTPGTNDMPGRLVFSTTADNASSPTERLRIDSAGNVGIGASDAGTCLDVGKSAPSANTGNIRISPRAAAGQARYHLYNGGATAEWLFGQKTGTDHDFKLSKSVSGSESDYLTIDTSGRVLINTTTDTGGALLQVNSDRIRIATAKTPSSASDTGAAGEVCWDSSYIYVCTATNTWKRAALSTW